VLTEAAARGLGISLQPDFILDDFLAAGRVEPILTAFPAPELGIYAILPSNRQFVPHRVRVLMDFLAARVGAAWCGLPGPSVGGDFLRCPRPEFVGKCRPPARHRTPDEGETT
jgi:hypothetical protein